ncbi:hypothetical protein IC582_008566 [Cucumis melo]
MPIILEYAAAPTISLRTGLSDRLLFPTVLRRRFLWRRWILIGIACDEHCILENTNASSVPRNGTPRQSLLVPLARARLVFSARIPPASIEGIGEYSHYWVIYVFHLNTDLDK